MAMTDKMRWFKFYPGDWAIGTQGMSPHAKGLYIDMLCMQWHGRRLPADQEDLSLILPGLTDRIYRELMQNFEVVDGWLVNRRLERERADASHRSAVARKGAERRHANSDSGVLEQSPSSAEALPEHCYTETESEAETEAEAEAEKEAEADADSAPRKAARKRRPLDPLRWTFEDGFIGVTDDDRKRWAEAYPLLDIDGEILRAAEHVRTHVEKQRMTAWRRFLGDWMARGNGWKERDAKHAKATPAGAARSPEQYRPFNAPEDCDPSEYHRFRTPDGRPCSPSIYLTKGGRKRFITGEWYDDVIGGPPALPPAQTADEIALFGKISPRRDRQTDVA
jgi:uncharacterized protein YdaU (DUF1376 family)